jgi:hypothetical protein
MELTYHKIVSYEGPNSHPLYNALKRSIEHIQSLHTGCTGIELKSLTEQAFDIKVEYLAHDGRLHRYKVSFRDESYYNWFMLRWA